ncbi:redox-sensing transcriptional repressor Rex [Ruminococcus sp. CLA-AA-H200]|uniref:Redox-sensing transcriptional repressor Rex n=1 Tax=Ruminococcus turbiniformis TaxID=2881258 RepID=A0ABS8FVB8_9FIRM|nr:redox-sensing transcriptional repressor Rex [Ruminococcus turbiniformis]MCC2253564.1 redox-sensing transcriptional repressor Rex [Ruminococcus turbiniformis]
MEHRKISRAVISRLPRYHRYLGDLLEAGVERISSNDLSKKMNVTASQIRQDLNNFGGFGQQGYGYNVKYLYTEIGKILGLNKTHNFIIIGAGNLGQALANYASFEKSGFILKSLFDVNPRLEGMSIRGIQVRMMDELVDFLQNNEIEIAALTIPKSKVVEVADLLVANGIKAIWNFAHMDLDLPKDVIVESVHLSDSLMQLSYNISRRKEAKKK